MNSAEVQRWERRLQAKTERFSWITQTVIVEACRSTQDEAERLAADKPGLAVFTLKQSAGRGRLGRSWVQQRDHGLAVTFALDARVHDARTLPIRAGVAAKAACDSVLHLDAASGLGLRWPNDVVERRNAADSSRPGRKVAGVLVERKGGLLLLGVGVNVSQSRGDFPADLGHRATSLQQLVSAGQRIDRLDVAAEILGALDTSLSADAGAVAEKWHQADVLVGTMQEFEHDRRRYSGVVERIDPTAEVVLRTPSATLIRLPAQTTSLVQR